MTAKTLVARLIMSTRDGTKIIVDVHTDAGFHEFYRCYTQQGRKRKRFTGYARRQYSLSDERGLHVLAAQKRRANPNITDAVIRVYKKRAYQRLLNCAPTELTGGLAKTGTPTESDHTYPWLRTGAAIPAPNWPRPNVLKREDALRGGRR